MGFSLSRRIDRAVRIISNRSAAGGAVLGVACSVMQSSALRSWLRPVRPLALCQWTVDATIGPEPHPLFAMNQIGGYPAESREGDWTCPAQRLRSGRVMFSKETVRRFGIERCQSRIEAETTRPSERAASALIVGISWSQCSRSRMRSSHFLNF
jgi:hypothetical protein